MKFKTRNTMILLIYVFGVYITSSAQQSSRSVRSLPPLPDPEGFAGMFAGVSGHDIFCMGGANFPEKRPWDGGQKVWYDRIFRFNPEKGWIILDERLPHAAGYGISVTYQDEIIMAGGSNADGHLRSVYAMKWDQSKLRFRTLPDLPQSLANMAGCLNGSLLMLVGGTLTPMGAPLRQCLMLDLDNPQLGWVKLPDCPGPGRTQAIAGTYKGAFYVFGGEMAPLDSLGIRYRRMLKDAYSIRPLQQGDQWTGTWTRLQDMPRSTTAAAGPAPLVREKEFFFWGGVDDYAAAHRDPSTHPGFTDETLFYHHDSGLWSVGEKINGAGSRVTLPVIHWRDEWIYISGEKRPGVRTPLITGISIPKE